MTADNVFHVFAAHKSTWIEQAVGIIAIAALAYRRIIKSVHRHRLTLPVGSRSGARTGRRRRALTKRHPSEAATIGGSMCQSFRTLNARRSALTRHLASVAAVLLLGCSTIARADNCAGGTDATGNDCNGEAAVRGLTGEASHRLYLQGQAALWELRVDRARQRLLNGTAEVKAAEAELKTSEADLKAARVALTVAQKTKQSVLAGKGL